MASTVSLDLQDVPLRTSLKYLLRQLDLIYRVDDGLLTITSRDAQDEPEGIEVAGPMIGEAAGMGGDPFRGMGGMGGGQGGGAMGGFGGGMGGGMGGMPADVARRAPPQAAPEDPAEANAGDGKKAPPAAERAPEAKPATPPPPPRQEFIETAYWNPSVVTDADGRARVTFRAPSALADYRLTARGVTGADTLVGQATADLAVRKDVFVELTRPAALTEGDQPRFLARLHHRGVAGAAELRLTIAAGGRERVEPRAVELKGDGVEEVLFDPFDVPDAAAVRLTLAATVAGAAADSVEAEVPIRPWGVQEFASASGTASDDVTAFVGLPPGRDHRSPEMLIVVAPTVRRMLVELALGRDALAEVAPFTACLQPPGGTTADRASDLLGAASVLKSLRREPAGTPDAPRLEARVAALVADLVTAQNPDGGWPWVTGGSAAEPPPSDRRTAARATWALGEAKSLGLLTDPKVLDRAADYLVGESSKVDAADHATRAALLHALATQGKATFQEANALNRDRLDLPAAALAYLALTFARLDRPEAAGEILGVLGPRGHAEPAGPGARPRRFWDGSKGQQAHGVAETTALAALAYAAARPGAPELAEAVDWLLAHRRGDGWQPPASTGPALAALAAFDAGARGAADRYRLVVTVNDAEVYRAEVAGSAGGKAVRVPTRLLKADAPNAVRFAIAGRGTFGYAVTLTGFARDFAPDQAPAGRPAVIRRRAYLAAAPELDGTPLATGFSAVVNPRPFENAVTEVPVGGRARVVIDADRPDADARPAWARDPLILEESLPAGTTLVEGSVRSQASLVERGDGTLIFYFAPDRPPGPIAYEVVGHLPGRYRVLPASIRAAADPGRSHLGPAGRLTVLEPGRPSSDPYRPTPDELYTRGKAYFDAGRLADAAGPLEILFESGELQPDILKDVARMLLYVHIERKDSRLIVRDFEIVRAKAPELVIPFAKLLVIGRAYAAIGEFERATIGWRALAEASYLEDARIGGVLRERGRTLEGTAFLIDVWREYPNAAAIEGDVFALSQVLGRLAGSAPDDPAIRRELVAAGATRGDLLRQSLRLIDVVLTQSPRNPMADEASLALVGTYLELGDFEAVARLARRFAGLYAASPFLDGFQYAEALGLFHLGRYDRAVAVAEALASATYKDADGADQPSPNRWQALAILAQIADARRRPAEALSYYRRVADRFADAADAVEALTRRTLRLPDVTVVRPPAPGSKAGAAVPLTHRRVGAVDVKVYPVDLMRLDLARRDLGAIAGVDLAGIRPRFQARVAPGPPDAFEERVTPLDLPLADEGAYLVLIRGGELYASGVVLVSPLELEVTRPAGGDRVRILVRDARTGAGVPAAQVQVTGPGADAPVAGRTDLRGVFTAEGLDGPLTVVARRGVSGYAYHRDAGATAPPGEPRRTAPGPVPRPSPPLGSGFESTTRATQDRQIDRLQQRHQAAPAGGLGGLGGMMGGGFR